MQLSVGPGLDGRPTGELADVGIGQRDAYRVDEPPACSECREADDGKTRKEDATPYHGPHGRLRWTVNDFS